MDNDVKKDPTLLEKAVREARSPRQSNGSPKKVNKKGKGSPRSPDNNRGQTFRHRRTKRNYRSAVEKKNVENDIVTQNNLKFSESKTHRNRRHWKNFKNSKPHFSKKKTTAESPRKTGGEDENAGEILQSTILKEEGKKNKDVKNSNVENNVEAKENYIKKKQFKTSHKPRKPHQNREKFQKSYPKRRRAPPYRNKFEPPPVQHHHHQHQTFNDVEQFQQEKDEKDGSPQKSHSPTSRSQSPSKLKPVATMQVEHRPQIEHVKQTEESDVSGRQKVNLKHIKEERTEYKNEKTFESGGPKRKRPKPNMTLRALVCCLDRDYDAYLKTFRRALEKEKASWFQAHIADALKCSSDAVALVLHLFLDPKTLKKTQQRILIPIRQYLLQAIDPNFDPKSNVISIQPQLPIQPRHFHILLQALDGIAFRHHDHLSAKHLHMLYRFFPPEYRELFIDKISDCARELCRNHRHTQRLLFAAKLVIKFKIHKQKKISKEILLYPLIKLKKHLNIVFDYITSAPSEILEDLQIKALLKIADPKFGNAPTKAYQKIQEWSLGLERFPKIIYYRRQSALQWLVSIDRHMEFLDFIEDDNNLLIYLCKELQQREKKDDIETVVKQFDLDFNYVEPNRHWKKKAEPEINIPVLSMESFDIRWVIVDNLEKLVLASKAIMRENVVGLDTESLPVQIFHPNKAPPPVQIFQIGTRHCAYIFDLKVPHLLSPFFSFLSRLFSDTRIIKIGMNFQIDLRDLRQQYPVGKWHTECFFQIKNFLELMNLKPIMINLEPKEKPSGKKETGLEKIFRHIVGIGLDKTQRISNWARRPLSNAQISYAAIDVICEVMIYETLCKQGFAQLPELIGDYSYSL